jgi:hypothetical protein
MRRWVPHRYQQENPERDIETKHHRIGVSGLIPLPSPALKHFTRWMENSAWKLQNAPTR